jgi:hypothetical protein
MFLNIKTLLQLSTSFRRGNLHINFKLLVNLFQALATLPQHLLDMRQCGPTDGCDMTQNISAPFLASN